ncbi:MAG: T9SS type A sorting domain-containing protein [Bacteroidota bacterium]|nr:T9SS type A sorting domain-containing protein [Bacteroidota bacterium]
MKRILLLIGLLIVGASLQVEAKSETEIKTSKSDTDFAKSETVYFFENQGEYPNEVSYYAKTWFGNLFINHNNEMVYSLPSAFKKESNSLAFIERLIDAKNAKIYGENGETGKFHLFKNGIETHSEKANYESIRMEGIYEGIDLQLKMQRDNIEKIFIVEPNANHNQIRIAMDGVKSIAIDENQMQVETALGDIHFTAPIAFQYIHAEKIMVQVEYSLFDNNEYGFKIGEYNPEYTLYIDPLLASTFIGGTDNDNGLSLALDNNGKLFMAGYTWSSNYPTTTGVYDETYNGGSFDAFISRFDTLLTTLEVSTFIGGSNYEEGVSLAIDTSTGEVYLGGTVESANFPTTTDCYNNTHSGGESDLFISKLSNDLSSLPASTYLGGNGDDVCTRLIYDHSSDEIFITGYTKSTDYPTTTGAYDDTFDGAGTLSAAFVSRLDSDLTTLQASTLIEGSNADEAHALKFDNNGDILLAGYTVSLDWPVTGGAYDNSQNSNKDAFLLRLNYDLTTLMNSTFIGGGYYDWATDLLQDASDNIYIVGHTASDDYPTTTGAYNETFDNAVDVFISKFSADMSTLLSSTYIGGDSWEYAYNLEMGIDGHLFLSGNTYSDDYPTTYGSYDTVFNGAIDVFITKIDTDLTNVLSSTFIGGTDFDYAEDIVIDEFGQVFFTGYTASGDYPTTSGVYNETFNGTPNSTRNAFISKFDKNLSTEPPSIITQPIDQTVCENTDAEFIVDATGGGIITYQWYQGNSGTYSAIAGATNDTLTLAVNLTMDGDSIFCLVENEGGAVYSDTVQLNVDELIASDAGSDQQTCEVNTAVMAATPPTSGTGFWYRISGAGAFGAPNDPGSAVIGLGIGDNEFVWEVTNGTCIATDTVVITQDTIVTANAGSDINICDVNTADMNAVAAAPGIGTWTVNDTGTPDDVNDPTTQITALDYGTNSFTWEVVNGACTDSDDMTIIRDSLIIADAGMDQIFCEDDTTTLSANNPAPGSGTWTVISGNGIFDDATNPNTLVSALDYRQNEFEWTITNGACVSSDTVMIQRDSLIIADAGTDLNLCDIYHTVITAEDADPGTGIWSVTSGSGTFAQPTQNVTTVSGLSVEINELVWEVTHGTCVSTDTLIIDIDTTITAQAGSDQQICGDSTGLNALNPAPGIGMWSVYNGGGVIADPTNYQTNISGLNAGSNILHWTVTNGACEDYDEIEIISDTLIVAFAGNDTTICHTNAVQLNAQVDAPGIGTWSLFSGNGSFVNVNDPQTIISNLAPEENVLIWSVASGSCITTDTVTIYRDTLIFAETEADFSICGTSTEISGNMPLTPMYSGFWEVISGNADFSDSTQMVTTVSNLQTGDNVFQWNVTNGFCTETAQLTVTGDTIIPAVTMPNQTLCDTSSLIITADDATPATAWWSIISGGGTIADSSANITTITNLPEGETVLQWTVVNGACTETSNLTITRNILVVADLGADYAVCDSIITLTGNDPTPGIPLWTVESGDAVITSPNNAETEVTNLNEGDNTFVYTITNGSCVSSDTIIITRDIFMEADAGTDISLCQEDEVTLPSDDNGTWALVSGSADVNNTSSLTDPIAIITNIALGENEFSFTITNGACVDTDFMTITRDSLVIANAGPDMEICDDYSSTLIAESVGVGTGTWSTPDSLPSIDNPNQDYTNVNELVAGENNFVWTVENGACVNTDTMKIIRYESVFLLAQPQTRTVIQRDTIMFIVEVEGDFTEFQWMKNGVNLVDTLQISGATNDTLTISRISIDDAGTYTCIIRGICGDVYSNSAELFVDGGITIFPNPTSGELNIHISRLEESYTVRVYDATGRLVKADHSTHNRLLLDMSDLRDGLYIVSLVMENQTINYKVVKD